MLMLTDACELKKPCSTSTAPQDSEKARILNKVIKQPGLTCFSPFSRINHNPLFSHSSWESGEVSSLYHDQEHHHYEQDHRRYPGGPEIEEQQKSFETFKADPRCLDYINLNYTIE